MTSTVELLSRVRQLQQAGAFAQAEQLCRQILQTEPSHTDAWCFLGEACESQGKLADAEMCYRRAIQILPGYANAFNWLGMVLARQGRMAEAVTCFQQAVHSAPANAEFHHNLGVAFDRQRQTAAAIDCYKQAIRLRPNFAQASYNLGLALNAEGQRAEAAEQFRQALRYQANYPEALNDLGNALAALEQFDEAVASYRKALSLRPDFGDAHYNLGIALGKQGKPDEAIAAFRRALQCKADFVEAHLHLGNALRLTGQMQAALTCFETALRLKPALPDAHWNRALLWLLCGDFEQGWAEYEWRWAQHDFARRHFIQPRWDGTSLGGRTILLYSEQGLGDTMQFVRYVPLVQERGGNVILECQPQLEKLLAGFPGIDRLIPTGAALPPFDVQAPLLSLPGVFRTTLDTIPRSVPYLHAKPELVNRWREKLATYDGFKIGIAWQGNLANATDRQRSIPLKFFERLAQVGGVQVVSLQKGPGADQLRAIMELAPPSSQFPILELGATLDEDSGPFMDTAAIMINLDLVVSMDTSVAHLAGALGVPVWVALTMAPDWRWLLNREDSPWYPTLRLFRQRRFGDWDDVFERMAGELKALVQKARSC
jgi:tetratricopeptide (TPR) repeat protein